MQFTCISVADKQADKTAERGFLTPLQKILKKTWYM